ncbi:hypothetical protein ABZ721_24050 [Streptomyces sp. NPDC006733]|uniref:hypothetical protein n=1 Tax=Streptomyces sp. NPDC006733 TaxID=3155460 RepID=UPI0033DB28E7
MDPLYFQLHFQVNVPIKNTAHPEQSGLHVLIGPADTETKALQIARKTCEAALDARAAGNDIPRSQPDGWGARGVRPGWAFDWAEATVDSWESPQRQPASAAHMTW